MNIHLTKSQIGLDGVPAAETVLSHVDGERGELIIAGDFVGSLAGKSSFESVTARLWSGATGRVTDEAHVRASLGAARERAKPADRTRGSPRAKRPCAPASGLGDRKAVRSRIAGHRKRRERRDRCL